MPSFAADGGLDSWCIGWLFCQGYWIHVAQKRGDPADPEGALQRGRAQHRQQLVWDSRSRDSTVMYASWSMDLMNFTLLPVILPHMMVRSVLKWLTHDTYFTYCRHGIYLIKKLMHIWDLPHGKTRKYESTRKAEPRRKTLYLVLDISFIWPTLLCYCVVAASTTEAGEKGAEAMSGRFGTMEKKSWRLGVTERREGEMGAERFEMARSRREGRDRAGVIYPFRWRAL
jgi:hypothetical protein